MPKRKVLNLILFIMLFLGAVGAVACGKPEEHEIIQNPVRSESDYFVDNNDGTVTISYSNTEKKRCKVVIQKDGGKMYQYDIPEGDVSLVLPLSLGNGIYKLYLCKNVKDNKYSVVESFDVTLSLDDENSAFLTSSVIINWDMTNEAIKTAQKLTKDLTSDDEKIKTIHEYIVTNYTYDYDKSETVNDDRKTAYVPDITDTYESKKGICYDLSALFAAMLRSVDIPAKVVTGYTAKNISYHAWNNVWYRSKENWQVTDVTYDIQMYENGYRYYIIKKQEDYADVVYVY